MPKRLLRILDVAKRLDELVLVNPIDLKNFANDYTFLIPIHSFKTGWMITMYGLELNHPFSVTWILFGLRIIQDVER